MQSVILLSDVSIRDVRINITIKKGGGQNSAILFAISCNYKTIKGFASDLEN